MPEEVKFGITIAVLVFLFLITWLLFFLVQYQKKKRTFQEDQQKMEATYKVELTRVQQVGYELHDNIGQLVTLAKIQIQNLLKTDSRAQLQETYNVVSKALEELRSLSKSLDTGTIEHFSIEELLQRDIERINKLGHIHCNFNTIGTITSIDGKKKIIIYRMIQEIITNALKHANCDVIDIRIIYDSGQVKFIISDNGKGFKTTFTDSKNTNGSGLKHLKNRVNLVGGHLLLNSSPGNGTRYEIVCPKSSICNIK
jgi:two-component system, NarL family, sensor kinase